MAEVDFKGGTSLKFSVRELAYAVVLLFAAVGNVANLVRTEFVRRDVKSEVLQLREENKQIRLQLALCNDRLALAGR